MTDALVDTSVAVPLLLASHERHDDVSAAVGGRSVGIAAHAQLETCSVVTRSPGDARLAPLDAFTLIVDRFGDPVPYDVDADDDPLLRILATAAVAGGAVDDALIGLTARRIDATLITRDTRAAPTFRSLDARDELLGV